MVQMYITRPRPSWVRLETLDGRTILAPADKIDLIMVEFLEPNGPSSLVRAMHASLSGQYVHCKSVTFHPEPDNIIRHNAERQEDQAPCEPSSPS